jgi:hypothetical protein
MLGLTRDDYSFIKYFPILLKSIVNKIVSNELAYDLIFLTKLNSSTVISKNSIEDFKYSLITEAAADLRLAVIEPNKRPVVVYLGDGAENTAVSNSYGLTINITPERYEPTIKLESIILSNDFVRGYKYKYLPGQVLPAGFIVLGPNLGRYPALAGARNTVSNTRLFEGKNTKGIIDFLFRLFKLRKGAAYDTVGDKISTGPEDFQPLSIWFESPLVADFMPEALVGNETNEVTVWLPFSYKRDSIEWQLAHEICSAFLNNYTIGYHEFTADYSAADEPVNTIEGYTGPPVYLDICPIFHARENFSATYIAERQINNPDAVTYVTEPQLNSPNSITYITD